MKNRILGLAVVMAAMLSLVMAPSAMATPNVTNPYPTYDVQAYGPVVSVDISDFATSTNPDPDVEVTLSAFAPYPCGGNIGDTQVSYTPQNFPDSSNSCAVWLTDGIGGSVPVSVTFNEIDTPSDTEAPIVSITSPVNGDTLTNDSVTLGYTVIDNLDPSPTCVQEIGGVPFTGTTVTLAEGPNVITVTCTDAASNGGSATVNVTYVPPDNEAPVVTIYYPADGQTVPDNFVTVSFGVTDNLDPSPTCNRDSVSDVALNEGPNEITVTCTDAAGNEGSATVNVTSDTQAPVVTITAPANGTTFTVNTANLTFGVTDDQDPIPTCDQVSGSDVPLPNVGSNTITVNCTDEANNTGSASVTVTYAPPPDPNRVKIKLGNLTVREGNTNREVYVPISLSRPYDRPITLSYSTQQGQGRNGATSNVDYVAVTNELVTIPANQTEWELPVTIIGDVLKESSENFFVIGDLTVESDLFAILVKDKATVVIKNDDKSGCNDGFNHGHSGHDDDHNGRDDGHED